MDVTNATSILFRVYEQPAVKSARASLDEAQRELDKVELSLKSDINTRRANYEYLYETAFQTRAQALKMPLGLAMLGTIVGGTVAVSHIAAAVPALAPYGGILTIAAFIGGLKYGAPLMRDKIVHPIVDRSANKLLTRFLEAEQSRASVTLTAWRREYNTVVAQVTDEMTRQAAQEIHDRQSQPHGEITLDEQNVTIGGVVVPRQAPGATREE